MKIIDVAFQGQEYSDAPDEMILADDVTIEMLEEIRKECRLFEMLAGENTKTVHLNYAVYLPNDEGKWGCDQCYVAFNIKAAGQGDDVFLYQTWVGKDHSGDCISSDGFSISMLIKYLEKNKAQAA